jgi:hypothetical protein
MPIFARTFDFIAWLLPASNNFPRAHRHTLTRRLLDAAFDLCERLEQANLQQARRLAPPPAYGFSRGVISNSGRAEARGEASRSLLTG